MYVGVDKAFPSKVSSMEGDGKLENLPNSCNPIGEHLKCCQTVPLPCGSSFQDDKTAVADEAHQFHRLKYTSDRKALADVCENAGQKVPIHLWA